MHYRSSRRAAEGRRGGARLICLLYAARALTIHQVPIRPNEAEQSWATTALLELQRAQAERVSDHRHRAERHRKRCNDRTEKETKVWVEDACGNRDADYVVGECKYQILADVTHRRAAQDYGPRNAR